MIKRTFTDRCEPELPQPRSKGKLARIAAVAMFGGPLAISISAMVNFSGIANVADATTLKQCDDRMFACHKRCGDNANDKYGKGTKRAAIESGNCANRTCMPQYRNCKAAASDAPKPNASVDPGSPTSNQGTKVVPGGVKPGSGATAGNQ